MIIRLPTKFYYEASDDNYAYVEDSILYINGTINYDTLMYNLTYSILGYNKCYYCGRELKRNLCTLDHINPRALGGLSLTNNLLPACKNCNGEKSDLTLAQYKYLKRLKTNHQRSVQFQKFQEKNQSERSKGKIFLPSRWLTNYDVSYLEEYLNFNKVSLKNVKKHEDFFKQTESFIHPIVVSSNDWLLKGMNVVFVAKKYGIRYVPAIVLDNVIVNKIK